MSTTYFAWTFPARSSDATGNLRSLEDVGHLLPADECPKDLLMCSTRNGWLLGTVAAISSKLNIRSFSSFHKMFAVVAPDAISSVVDDIDSFLSSTRNNPALLAGILGESHTSLEVLEALEHSKEASIPHLGPDNAEEGDDAQYLFDWLKSLRTILRTAEANGMCVIHVQPESQRSAP